MEILQERNRYAAIGVGKFYCKKNSRPASYKEVPNRLNAGNSSGGLAVQRDR